VTRKSIQTNGPVVTCDVCGRTLLRGETPDVFLHGGSRRMVCELCTARAGHEGWIREGLDDATVRSGDENRAGGGFFARLRSRRAERREILEPLAEATGPDSAAGEEEAAVGPAPVAVAEAPPEEPPAPPAEPRPAAGREPLAVPPREHRNVHAIPTNAELKMARSLDLFNGSSHRRTVAGVARSLGPPIVSVRPSVTEGSVVGIVVAWELSWYRFEVDLADEAAGVRVVDQGAELSELDPAEQEPNAAADDAGELHLVAQHA
jgi:hypothetical protein